jgi:hypothetical protein
MMKIHVDGFSGIVVTISAAAVPMTSARSNAGAPFAGILRRKGKTAGGAI